MKLISEYQWQQILSEINFSYARSSGPGGQKVNKTSSKVELRWSLALTQAFNEHQLGLLNKKLATQLSKDSEILVFADSFRSRERNKDAACERLREILERALHVPKKRKKTKPSRSSVESRLKVKQKHGEKKRSRQKVDY